MNRNTFLTVFASVVVVGIAGFEFSRHLNPAQPPKKSDAAYVDSAACADCHGEIAETYRRTGMGRSFSRSGPENTVADFKTHNTLYHKPSDRYYTMLEQNGKFYERRHQLGFGGKETNQLEKQVDFVIGSGNHARTYMHRDSEGKLVELPVSWYSDKGGYWAMSPGYDRADQQDFRRRAGNDCLFCHNGYRGYDRRR